MPNQEIVWDARVKEGDEGRLENVGLYRDEQAAMLACQEHHDEEFSDMSVRPPALEWTVLETRWLPRHHIAGAAELTYLISPREVK